MDGRPPPAGRAGAVCALAAAALALFAPARAPAATPPQITSGPTIAGTAQVGGKRGAPAPWPGARAPAVTWRWRRCQRNTNPCSRMGGATSATYSPTAADVGAQLRVPLAVRNSAGSDDQRSAPTTAVTPAPV